MNTLRDWMIRHPLRAFFALACIFSWTLWALMFASAQGWLPFNFPTNWTGSFGPTIAALLVMAVTRGRQGLLELLRPIGQWRFGLGWYAFALIGSLVPIAVAIALFVLLGNPLPAPLLPLTDVLVQVPMFFVIVFVLGGPLGEEIGWRGFALPRLLKQYSPLMSTLVVFVMWLTWHLPLFWLPGASQEGVSIASFALMMLGYSVLFTWVYQGTRGSLLSVLLMHTSINTASVVMSGLTPGLPTDPVFNWLFAIAALALAFLVLVLNPQMLHKSGDTRTTLGRPHLTPA